MLNVFLQSPVFFLRKLGMGAWQRPHPYCESCLRVDDFRGDVGWRTTLFVHGLTSLHSLGDAEIGNLDQALAVKEDVVEFDIAVKNGL